MSTSAPRTPFWAKQTSGATYHPLIAHSADVAAVFRALTEPGTALFERLVRAAGGGEHVGALRPALVYLAALHDLGKTNHGFQDKDGPWARPHRRWPAKGHVIPVIAGLGGVRSLEGVVRSILTRLPFDDESKVSAFRTAVAHHGRPWLTDPHSIPTQAWARVWAPDPESGRAPLEEIGRVAEAAARWSGVREEPRVPWTVELSHLFAGLLTISDWIGSTEAFFPFAPGAEADPDAYWSAACEKAQDAVSRVGSRPRKLVLPPEFDVYARLFPETFPRHSPTALQEHLAKAPLPGPGARAVVESETGSGKTEAALALYARLRAEGRVDGMVFALPTRASATAMYERIRRAIPRLFDVGSAPTLALAMGGRVNEFTAGSGVELEPRLFPDAEDDFGARWASEGHKRVFAAEVVVGTVDQVLLAGLAVKHAHMRPALLTRHLLVVDEVHSYDRYMSAVLGRVVDYHSGVGGVSLFISATLSRHARDALAPNAVEAELEESIRAPYPAVSVYEPSAGRWTQTGVGRGSSEKQLRWHTVSLEASGDAAFDEAVRLADNGGRVCILRNTVKEALATVDLLRRLAPDRLWRPDGSTYSPPYHSRFLPADRLHLDEAVRRTFGRDSPRRDGVILVATQVVEQSLDVDFDWMMTDLAPIDVLLQRAGRIHRHARSDRPHEVAAARMAVHARSSPFEPRKEFRDDFGWGTVYGEIADLELTRRLIAECPDISIPRDNRRLVELVYHPDARERLAGERDEWRAAVEATEGRDLGRNAAAAMVALDFARTYPDQATQYGSVDRLLGKVRTRIGDDHITVGLDRPVAGWYAPEAAAQEVPIRFESLMKAGASDLAEVSAMFESEDETGSTYRVGEKLRMKYSPNGWVEIWD